MQIKNISVLAAALAAAACSQKPGAGVAFGESVSVTTDEQKAFYALGYTTGERMAVFAMTPAEQDLVARWLAPSYGPVP